MTTFTSGLFRDAVKNFNPGMPLSAYSQTNYSFTDCAYLVRAEKDNIKGSFIEFHSKNWTTSSYQTKLNMINSYIYNELCYHSYPVVIYDIIEDKCTEADIDAPLEFQYLSFKQVHISLYLPAGLIAKIEADIKERMLTCEAFVSHAKVSTDKLRNLPDLIYMNRNLGIKTIQDVNYNKVNLRM